MKSIALTDDEVRTLLSNGAVTVRRPITLDDTPITDAEADRGAHQRGIPTNAQNVRMCGDYVKSDSPDGSVTVSSRVDCPWADIVDIIHHTPVAVMEAWAEYEPDDVQGTRVYYRAGYIDGDCQVRPGWHLTWGEAETMPVESVRLHVRVTHIGCAFVDGVWMWVLSIEVTARP